MKNVVKWSFPAVLLTAGVALSGNVTGLVEMSLPEVSVTGAVLREVSDTVTGSGVIIKTDDGWFADIAVSESDVRFVKPGQRAVITGAGFAEYEYTASVAHLADFARTVSVAGGMISETIVDVRLKLDSPDENLRTGYSAQAAISTGDARDALVLPYEVIEQDGGGEYIFVLEGGGVAGAGSAGKRYIRTGLELPSGVEILSGLLETDEVITDPKAVYDKQAVKAIVN